MPSLQDRTPQSLLPLRAFADARGTLVAIEGERDLPFPIARVYYIVGLSGEARGFHAHRALDQLLVCVAGSCRLIVDDGIATHEHILDRPDRGLHVKPYQWREMRDFSADCVLLALASAAYNEADYIRDYPTFLAEVTARNGR